jgi:hypothetical protein
MVEPKLSGWQEKCPRIFAEEEQEYELEVAHGPRQPELDMPFDPSQPFVRGGVSLSCWFIFAKRVPSCFSIEWSGAGARRTRSPGPTGARSADAAAVHLDDPADQRQADPQPTRGVKLVLFMGGLRFKRSASRRILKQAKSPSMSFSLRCRMTVRT